MANEGSLLHSMYTITQILISMIFILFSGDMTKVAIRAMVAGNLACWISACIAGE